MKKKTKIRIYSFAIIGVFLVLTSGCNKSNDENNNPLETSTVTDIEGNVYKTVKIGNQWWMAENLKTTKYNNDTSITLVTDGTAWTNLFTPGYCWYNNDPATFKNTYGALYNWYAVNTGKLAPKDWHVPTLSEWDTLLTYLGGKSVAGGKMREAGTTHWLSPNTGADNSSGFTALPSGARGNSNGNFGDSGDSGGWWAGTEFPYNNGWCCLLYNVTVEVNRVKVPKNYGLSVRCVKNL